MTVRSRPLVLSLAVASRDREVNTQGALPFRGGDHVAGVKSSHAYSADTICEAYLSVYRGLATNPRASLAEQEASTD